MSTFSQRMGFRPAQKIQIDSIDRRLRNDLWSVIFYYVINQDIDDSEKHPIDSLCLNLWVDFSEQPIDEAPTATSAKTKFLKELYFSLEWHGVYDLLEFIAEHFDDYTWFCKQYESFGNLFIIFCNNALKKNVSGYRFVGRKVAPITNDQEIATVEKALNVPATLAPVSLHLKTALDRLADKPKPDYRNSIKESISAVESLCALLAGKKTELKPSLREIEKKGEVHFHPALKAGFEKLYGYTSDAAGIRHALMDEPNLDVEDAVYMLVTCSAFINYLVRKAEKAGIQF